MYNKVTGRSKQGFTLLELLIVIAIIAILSVILIIVLDPAETLKKSRDSQRISDLNTMKTAIGIWTTTTSTPILAGTTSTFGCKSGTTKGASVYNQGVGNRSFVFYSVPTSSAIAVTALIDGIAGANGSSSQTNGPSSTLTDGTGWIPVPFDQLTGGSPISNEPLDPTNAVTAAQPINADLNYRYACNASTTKWEADAELESTTFTVQDNKMAKDGGNNNSIYEVGTDLTLLGATNTF